MDHLFDNADDDFFSFDSAAAGDGDDDDDFLLPQTRRRRLYSPPPPSSSLRHDRLFFVSFRWWKEAMADCLNGEDGKGVLYTASSHGVECESGSDIVLRLDRQKDDDEKAEGFSGREYALISGSMSFKALKWHSDYCTTIKDIRHSLAAEDNDDDVLPIQIRLSMIWHSKSLVAKICHMISVLGKSWQLLQKNIPDNTPTYTLRITLSRFLRELVKYLMRSLACFGFGISPGR